MAEKKPKFALQNLWFFHSYISWYKEGEGRVTKMLILAHIGGGGVQKGSNLAHMIYEQPLTALNFLSNYHFLSHAQYFHTVEYETGTVEYNTIQYSTARYITVQCDTVQHSIGQYSTAQHSTSETALILVVWICNAQSEELVWSLSSVDEATGQVDQLKDHTSSVLVVVCPTPLHCTILYYTVQLYWAILHCTILYYTVHIGQICKGKLYWIIILFVKT